MFSVETAVAAAAAGLAAALWVNSPIGQVSRAAQGEEVVGPAQGAPAYRSLLTARPDAAPFRRRLLVATAGSLAVALALASVGPRAALAGWLLMPMLALVGAVTLGRLEPTRTRLRRQRLVLDLPQALELLSACLSAGMPLRQGASAVAGVFEGPVADDLGQVRSLVELGVSDADAWSTLAQHPQWGAAATDVARSVQSGTMMVEVLVHHARHARRDRRAQLEVRAKSVGVRSVLPLMTCFLPAFLLLGVVPTVASAVLNALR